MTLELLIRYLHFLSILFVFGSLFAEFVLVDNTLSKKKINKLAKIDGVYGLASIVLFGAGLTLWFGVGKPSSFYTENPIFISKFILVSIVGVLSIWPTVFFLKNRKGEPSELVEVPAFIKKIILVELLLLCIVPILAVFMAKGVGL